MSAAEAMAENEIEAMAAAIRILVVWRISSPKDENWDENSKTTPM
jgi:hypothetical protein